MKYKAYKGMNTKEISFPLGGIGTGCIGLAGNGMLWDWEIYNRPNKNSINGYSNLAIKAEDAKSGKLISAKALNGDYVRSFAGEMGPARNCMAGLPHFADAVFKGAFPIAEMNFRDAEFPADIKLTAFNPFIPLNDRESSIPAAFMEYEVKNTTARDVDYTICFSIRSNLGGGPGGNRHVKSGGYEMMHYFTERCTPDKPEWGEMTVATDCSDVSFQENWYRGKGFEPVTIFWRDFTSTHKFANRTYEDMSSGAGMASLAAHVRVAAGKSAKVRFIISWNFPNFTNYWNPYKCECAEGETSCCDNGKDSNVWKNYYATVYENSTSTAAFALDNWDRLHRDTLKFKNALFGSTLPDYVLEAVSGNISILKSPTCIRLSDGSFYGFEGCSGNSGCCDGSCTHVWNYAYALPFLFPKLERSMRDLDYTYNLKDSGEMTFRLNIPLGLRESQFRACADGLFGGIVKTYRDWKICGDTEWLRRIWPAAQKSLEFAWSPDNKDKWDPDKSGVLTGRQHHTLDEELFGPSSWLMSMYAAALKAGSEMARAMGQEDKSLEYEGIFTKCTAYMNEKLFNGDYFQQVVDLTDKSAVERFDAVEHYWNEEKGEIRYQIGDGCAADQMLGQWHANIAGLGTLFDKNKKAAALKSIYRNNFKNGMRGYFNPCRLYCFNDEAGTVICDWPEGKYMPQVPLQYAQEAMNGFEYSTAVLLIQEGMIEEGLEMVAAVRERYDGAKRNPWNEFECGHNYARSMASYSLLPALSGFEFDMCAGTVGFSPLITTEDDSFKCFFSLDSGWGTFTTDGSAASLDVLYGTLALNALKLGYASKRKIKAVTLGGKPVEFTRRDGEIAFAQTVRINPKNALKISF